MARIAFFPEAAFGPALNSVGIAQACRKLGHEPVFLCDPGFVSVFEGYGFPAHGVPMSEPMAPEESAKYWVDFINGHIPNFRKSPYEQIDNYVKDCWEAIVSTAVWAEKSLPAVLAEVKPDLICIDNVILFPATKRYGVPWVRIISCSENEIPDPDIPPHLSGCGEHDKACFAAYTARFNEVVAPDPRPVQRVPGRVRRAALPAGRVLRALALAEPPALPGAGEVQAPPRRSTRSASSTSKAACARRRPTRSRPSPPTPTSRWSMSASAAWARATPTCSSA